MPKASDKTAGLLEYSHNNSGGRWWLSDQNWTELETNGWTVRWFETDEFYKERVDEDGRWLGALATDASKRFASADEGVREWSSLTGERASDVGCNCCGPPHSFTWKDDDGTTKYGSAEVVETSLGWW